MFALNVSRHHLFSSQGGKENVLTLWKMDPHQARMGFAQAVDNSLIPGKLLFHVQEKHIYIY